MTTHRERLFGAARADLVALPELVEELSRLVADRHHDITGYKGRIAGSPAPLSIPVVHLTDGGRHKPAWHGEDPRQPRFALTWYDRTKDEKTAHTRIFPTEAGAWDAFDRLQLAQQIGARVTPWRARDIYGVAGLLETWVRILWEEMPELPDLTEQATVRSEASVLVEHWAWISEQGWAEELANDVTAVTEDVRAALGEPKEQKYLCPECRNPAYLVPGGILSCQEGHERVVRDLEQQQRRRPMATTKEICDEFGPLGVNANLLRQWKFRRKIKPARTDHGQNWWWPWDVFCLVNPDIADALNLRDETEAG
jgi:hypothetical protein